jgi:hypothetical protein
MSGWVMLEEEILAYCKVLSQSLPRRIEKIHEKSRDTSPLGRESSLESPYNEALDREIR